MLDANAFDHVLDRAIDPAAVRGLGEICITTVQHGELLSVPDPRRRRRLLGVLSAIDPTVRPAFVDARFHDGVADGAGGRSRSTSREPADRKDAAIAEVAALEGCILVTDDRRFLCPGDRGGTAGRVVRRGLRRPGHAGGAGRGSRTWTAAWGGGAVPGAGDAAGDERRTRAAQAPIRNHAQSVTLPAASTVPSSTDAAAVPSPRP